MDLYSWEKSSLKRHIKVNVQPGDGGEGRERMGHRSLSSFGEEGNLLEYLSVVSVGSWVSGVN